MTKLFLFMINHFIFLIIRIFHSRSHIIILTYQFQIYINSITRFLIFLIINFYFIIKLNSV